MLYKRRASRPVQVGKVTVGGGAPISVQSMTNTDTRDIKATVAQIKELEAAGCELVRTAVPDAEAAKALAVIRKDINIPLIADIHFDHRLALQALAAGVDGLRLNPGNIGGPPKVREVVAAARERNVPIRIGVNAGSLEKKIMAKHGGVTATAMVESALAHVRILTDMGYDQIKISLKASDIPLMLDACRMLARQTDFPLHLGVTEAGIAYSGSLRSAVGIGTLLAEGIGDTIRVSLTGDPCAEVRAAYEILKALHLRQRGVEIISCPTCGRCRIDLARVTAEVETAVQRLDKPLKVAIMGCVVNGPGEARRADVGIAGGDGVGVLFRQGKVIRKVPETELVPALLAEIERLAGSSEKNGGDG